jgi:hypothetical protein
MVQPAPRKAASVRLCGGLATVVFLTLMMIVGPVAGNRIILMVQRRIGPHSVHHVLGIVAAGCLVLQLTADLVVVSPVGVFGALVPLTPAPFVIGLGAVLAHLMLTAMRAGLVRAHVPQDERPLPRRPLPANAHVSWPVTLSQRLNPRPPPRVRIASATLGGPARAWLAPRAAARVGAGWGPIRLGVPLLLRPAMSPAFAVECR